MKALKTALLTTSLLLMTTPVALASEAGHDGGEGLWGETNDRVITNAGFILIAAFPTLLLILSLTQAALDRRKDRRKAAAKARTARADQRGGW